MTQMDVKKILFVFRTAPYSTYQAQEGLDALLAARIFDQHADILFIDDGVYQLLPTQAPIGMANIYKQLKSLPMYDVESAYVCQESLGQISLTEGEQPLELIAVEAARLLDLFRQYNHILSF